MLSHLIKRIPEQDRISYRFLAKWTISAITAGLFGSILVHYFSIACSSTTQLLASLSPPVIVWPVVGAVFAGSFIYRIERRAAGEGLPSYIAALRFHSGKLPFSVTFYKLLAALSTLMTMGNGGIVGPLGRVAAGVMSSVSGLLIHDRSYVTDDDQRTASICGLAAVIGAVFHSSIGGGIFAVEIIQKAKMGYRDLFPAILASSTAVFVCKSVGWESFYVFDAVDSFMELSLIGYLVLFSIIAGLFGGGYTLLYTRIAKLFRRTEGNMLFKVTVGSSIAALIAWAVNPELLGTSTNIIQAIFSNDSAVLFGRIPVSFAYIAPVLLIMALLKALCNCITVGSGMSAGFTGPAVITGMLLGAAMARLLGIECGSASYHAFIAVGFSAMLASSMNIPLAAAVMTTELFGLQYSFPAGFSAIIGFQVMRHQTIYDYAVNAVESESEDDD
ncbi:MAG: chloride channel protein [Chitinispirillaceae bacterium]|nr:chloride channel protein [Chitinispirillaceae bacterium]